MKRLIAYLRTKERHASAAVFFLGFLLDLFTLPRVDSPLVPYLVGGHMLIIGGSILLDRVLHTRVAGRFEKLGEIFPLITSFSFGAVLSFLLIYYARSSAIGASWPFLLLIGAVMFGSEFFRKKLEGLRFYVILYAFLAVLLSVLFMPTLLGKITVPVFFFSVVVGLLFSCLYLGLLFLVTREETRLILPRTILSLCVGTILLLSSYFLGVMPAIPLVLKEGEVCRSVVRAGDVYLCDKDLRSWYEGLVSPRIHEWTPGTPVYFYSSVFAPTALSGTIIHDWQHKDADGKWVSLSRIPFSIVGGREDGYRGYSYKESMSEGEWRVVVALGDGRVVGRVPFVLRRK